MVGGVLKTAPEVTVPILQGCLSPYICVAGSKGIVARVGKALQSCSKEEPSSPIPYVQNGIRMLSAITNLTHTTSCRL